MTAATLRIGTRGSRLARAQADLACRALGAAHPELAAPGVLELVVIRTTGDQVTDRPLAELGGKGLFCKELEAALLDRRIDLAVHSIKDLPTWLPEGLAIGAVLERADPRDVLIARSATTIALLPEAALIGTASVRRQAQLLAQRPDLRVVNFRGNVETRLRKLAAGEVDATLLARAGLDRLNLNEAGATTLSLEEMLPAVGQGAIGIECRADDPAALMRLGAIDHLESHACVRAERALLAALDGSCHTPIGGHARIADGSLHLRALIARLDGSECLRAERIGAPGDAEELGQHAGAELRARAGPGFFG
jgi:hydroxymethylbilane synthase